MKKSVVKKIFFTSLLYTVLFQPVVAQEWEVTFAPYLWGAGEKGEVATLPGVGPAEIDISFDDIWSNLEVGTMNVLEAYKGNFGIVTEFIYIKINTDEVTTPGPFFSGADYKAEAAVFSLFGSFRYKFSHTNLDLLFGTRYWYVDNTLELEPGVLPATSLSQNEEWMDIMVGFKTFSQLNCNWSINTAFLVSPDGDSKSQWDAFISINYAVTKSTRMMLGYRHLELDYDNGDFLYDVEISGPTIGAFIDF